MGVEYDCSMLSNLYTPPINPYYGLQGMSGAFTGVSMAGTITNIGNTTKQPKKEEGKTMLGNVKGYIEKHKDVIFTLGLVILVDHFLFRGALRERIKGTIEGVLKKAENLIDKSGDK